MSANEGCTSHDHMHSTPPSKRKRIEKKKESYAIKHVHVGSEAGSYRLHTCICDWSVKTNHLVPATKLKITQ